MSTEHSDNAGAVFGKLALLVLAWLGSITLGQVQTVVGILSGLAVLGYTVFKWRKEMREP